MGRKKKIPVDTTGNGASPVVEEAPKILKPEVVEQLSDPLDSIVLKPHHVLMIEVNPSGEEVPGTEFQIHKRGLLRSPFNNTEKFKLKKREA